MRKLKLIFIALLALLLFSCDKGGIAPEFRGMSIKREENTLLNNSSNSDIEYIENEFGVIIDSSISFYGNKNEDIIIALSFYNPSKFEIESFILNDIKYVDYQFMEYSTIDTIYLKHKLPNSSGVFDLRLKEIKYIDGSRIKDCKINGATALKIGVAYDLSNYYDKPEVLALGSNIKVKYKVDPSLIDNLSIYFFLNNKFIKANRLDLNKNEELITSLALGKVYNYYLVSTIDLLDGKGKKSQILASGEVELKHLISLNPTIASKAISFKLDSFSEATIDNIGLYLNNELIAEAKDNNYKFDRLLSNTKYQIRIKYSYKALNNKLLKEEYIYEFNTLALNEPKLELEYRVESTKIEGNVKINDPDNIIKEYSIILNDEIISNKDKFIFNAHGNIKYNLILKYSYLINNIEYEKVITYSIETPKEEPELVINLSDITINSAFYTIKLNDYNKVGKIDSIRLYKNDNLIEVLNLNSGLLNNLDINTKYKLVVEYSYDLDNGSGEVKKEVIKEFITLKRESSLDLKLESSNNSLKLDTILLDPDKAFTFNNISIYDGETKIGEYNTYNNLIISNLVPGTKYKIILSYSYNDNFNTYNKELIKYYTLMPYSLKIDKLEILNKGTLYDGDLISFKLSLNNKDKYKLSNLIINNKSVDIIGGDRINSLIFNYLCNKNDRVIINSLSYQIDSYYYQSNLEYEININLLDKIDLKGISLLNGGSLYYIKGVYSNLPLVLEIDNKLNLDIDHINLDLGLNKNHDVFRINKINNNLFHLDIKLSNPYDIDNIKINYIEFHDSNGLYSKRIYNTIFQVNLRAVKDIKENYIYNLNDLLNMNGNNHYILMNDIDFNYNLYNRLDFTGSLDGRGHTISNMIINDSSDNNSYNLFTFNIINTYFNNLEINLTGSFINLNIVDNNYEFKNNIIDFKANLNKRIINIKPNNYLTTKSNYNYSNLIDKDKIDDNFKSSIMGWNYPNVEIKEFEGLIYKELYNSYNIIIGSNKLGHLNILDNINGLDVLGIEDFAFKDNNNLTSIEFSLDPIYMGINIFDGLCNIEKLINLPSRFNHISSYFSDSEFEGSYLATDRRLGDSYGYLPNSLAMVSMIINSDTNPKMLLEGGVALKDVKILGNTTSLPIFMMAGCENLSSLALPENLKRISSSMLAGTKNLARVVLPNNLESIEPYAFNGGGLEMLYIPNSCSKIGQYAFSSCSKLIDINIPDSVTVLNEGLFKGARALKCIDLNNVSEIHTESLCDTGIFDLSSVNKLARIHKDSLPMGLLDLYLQPKIELIEEQFVSITNLYFDGTREEFNKIPNIGILSIKNIIYKK